MRAAFCTGRGAIELRDVAPLPLAPGAVSVAVHACGICGSDLHYFNGESPPPPVCLGHEICGRIVDGTAMLPAGTPVVVEPLVPCGTCARCRASEPNLCPRVQILGSMLPGGLADRVHVPASSVYRLPAGLALDVAVLAEPLAVGVHAVRVAGLVLGEDVLVLGAGSIGLLAAYAALRAGARVTVSARHPHQRAAAHALGIADVIGDDEAAVRGAARAHRPDVVLETVGGTANTLDLALRVVRPGGRIVGLGKFTHAIALDPLRFLMKEVRLVSSMTYSRADPQPDFVTALELLAAEPERLARLITQRVPLAEVGRAFALAADKSSGAVKVVVDAA
jgi:2-desacetyl-2-hydroxyethyl bacteriochlorophyllide A dehydrogenase